MDHPSKEIRFDWAGARILRNTIIPSKRRVIHNEDVLIHTDLREWITPPDSQEIREVIEGLKLPHSKSSGEFDFRAHKIWNYVVDNIKYRSDELGQKKPDFWQFPAETLALEAGDCEDCAFLMATLLLASGISPFCVRVVFGSVKQGDRAITGHTWPIYKNESGDWVILESTLGKIDNEVSWVYADDQAQEGSPQQYRPDICLNNRHVWTVDPFRRIQKVSSYLHSMGWLPDLYSK